MSESGSKKRRPSPAPAEEHTLKVDFKDTAKHFARWESHIRAMDARELVPANLNMSRTLVLMLGAHRNLVAVREQIVATLTNFRVSALDDLPSLAYAAWHADMLVGLGDDPSQSCADLMPRAESLRETLLTSARSQVKRGNISQAVIDKVVPGQGIEDRANDLLTLAQAFRDAWKAIDGKTDVRIEELDEAEALAGTLFARLAGRSVATLKRDDMSPVEVRARALTMVARAYEECRRGGAAVWWYEPGGWEQFVPSLRSGLGGRSNAKDLAPPVEGDAPAPVAPPAVITAPVVEAPAPPAAPPAKKPAKSRKTSKKPARKTR